MCTGDYVRPCVTFVRYKCTIMWPNTLTHDDHIVFCRSKNSIDAIYKEMCKFSAYLRWLVIIVKSTFQQRWLCETKEIYFRLALTLSFTNVVGYFFVNCSKNTVWKGGVTLWQNHINWYQHACKRNYMLLCSTFSGVTTGTDIKNVNVLLLLSIKHTV